MATHPSTANNQSKEQNRDISFAALNNFAQSIHQIRTTSLVAKVNCPCGEPAKLDANLRTRVNTWSSSDPASINLAQLSLSTCRKCRSTVKLSRESDSKAFGIYTLLTYFDEERQRGNCEMTSTILWHLRHRLNTESAQIDTSTIIALFRCSSLLDYISEVLKSYELHDWLNAKALMLSVQSFLKYFMRHDEYAELLFEERIVKPERSFPGVRVVLGFFRPGSLGPFNVPAVVESARVCHLRMALYLATRCALLGDVEGEKFDGWVCRSLMEMYVEMEKIGEGRKLESGK